jgi:hypothetical protein
MKYFNTKQKWKFFLENNFPDEDYYITLELGIIEYPSLKAILDRLDERLHSNEGPEFLKSCNKIKNRFLEIWKINLNNKFNEYYGDSILNPFSKGKTIKTLII